MAGSMSTYLANKLLDHSLGIAPFTMPTEVYAALFTTDPTDAGTGTEVSGSGYSRKLVSSFSAAVNGGTKNTVDLLFPEATAAWGDISHVAIYDAATGGNMLYHDPATSVKTIDVNDQYRLGANNLTISLD